MSPQTWPILLPILIVACVFFSRVMNTWIRAKHGYPLNDRRGCGNDASADDVAGHVKHALANRDATIAKLEERVRVLERIVTDDSKRLSDELCVLESNPQPAGAAG
jgi:hypothetical protein